MSYYRFNAKLTVLNIQIARLRNARKSFKRLKAKKGLSYVTRIGYVNALLFFLKKVF